MSNLVKDITNTAPTTNKTKRIQNHIMFGSMRLLAAGTPAAQTDLFATGNILGFGGVAGRTDVDFSRYFSSNKIDSGWFFQMQFIFAWMRPSTPVPDKMLVMASNPFIQLVLDGQDILNIPLSRMWNENGVESVYDGTTTVTNARIGNDNLWGGMFPLTSKINPKGLGWESQKTLNVNVTFPFATGAITAESQLFVGILGDLARPQ